MENKAIVIPKEAEEMKSNAEKALELANKFAISDPATYEQAAAQVKDFISQEKELNKQKKALLDPLNETKTGIINWFSGPLDFLDKAKRAIKQSMISYDEKIEAEAKKRQAEADAAAERERKYQENLAKKRAETALKNNDAERAEEILEEAKEASNFIVPQTVNIEKVNAGRVGIKTTWSAEVYDLKALCKAVVDGSAPLNAITANLPLLNGLARSLKEHFNVPGVKAVSKKG